MWYRLKGLFLVCCLLLAFCWGLAAQSLSATPSEKDETLNLLEVTMKDSASLVEQLENLQKLISDLQLQKQKLLASAESSSKGWKDLSAAYEQLEQQLANYQSRVKVLLQRQNDLIEISKRLRNSLEIASTLNKVALPALGAAVVTIVVLAVTHK